MAVTLHPDIAACYRCGCVLEMQNKKEEAERCFKQVREEEKRREEERKTDCVRRQRSSQQMAKTGARWVEFSRSKESTKRP